MAVRRWTRRPSADLASDEALINAATTIRRLHDLSVGYRGEGWSTASAEPLGWPAGLDRARRLALFAAAYGMSRADRAALLDVVRERQELNRPAMSRLAEQGRIESTDPRAESGDLDYLGEQADRWRAALLKHPDNG